MSNGVHRYRASSQNVETLPDVGNASVRANECQTVECPAKSPTPASWRAATLWGAVPQTVWKVSISNCAQSCFVMNVAARARRGLGKKARSCLRVFASATVALPHGQGHPPHDHPVGGPFVDETWPVVSAMGTDRSRFPLTPYKGSSRAKLRRHSLACFAAQSQAGTGAI